jgi:carboxypeptidase family protein
VTFGRLGSALRSKQYNQQNSGADVLEAYPPALFAVLPLCGCFLGQTLALVTQPRTFHVKGTITDPIEAVIQGAKVTFESGQLKKSLITSGAGIYEADLPAGDYTMTARVSGFRLYRRRLFRVRAPADLIFDVRLQLGRCGDMVFTNRSGRPPTDAEIYAATESCRYEDLFPLSPHRDQLQLSIQYETRAEAANVFSYSGASREDPVSLSYNLFSLRADRVVYNVREKTLEAQGNVVMEDESGKRRADAIAFKLEDGRPKQLR